MPQKLPDHQDSPPDSVELLSFRLGKDEYSVDIMSVREIRGWTRVTSLPHAPDYVQGVINLRGTVLPVVDLARRLHAQTSDPDERNAIVVVDVGGRVVGLRVDAVSDILTVPRGSFQPTPDIAADRDQRFIEALTSVDERLIRILDLDAVLPQIERAA